MESILHQRKTGFIDTKERPIAAIRVGELLEEEIEESTQKQINFKEEKMNADTMQELKAINEKVKELGWYE